MPSKPAPSGAGKVPEIPAAKPTPNHSASLDKPIAVDLCSGYGGWVEGLQAAGFYVKAFDIEEKCKARNKADEFYTADIRHLLPGDLDRAAVVTFSPPCTRFARVRANYKKDPPTDKDLDLLRCGYDLIQKAKPLYWAIENVESAAPWFNKILGPPVLAKRPFYLWGHFPPFLLEQHGIRKAGWVRSPVHGRWIAKRGEGRDPRVRAKLPLALTRPFAEAVMAAFLEAEAASPAITVVYNDGWVLR